jgi:transposase
MEKISIVGLDLAKNTIQLHAACADGSVSLRRRISRGKLLQFLSTIDQCTVAMEACAGSHHWGREIAKLGHTVRLIAPIYVKPFFKRQKNDAAMRPTMRFVAVKSETRQASAAVFKVRDLLVRQKTQIINALRGHMAEFGGGGATMIGACRQTDRRC